MNRFRADLVLLNLALIWGSAFTIQREAARYFDAFTFIGLRILLCGLVLLPCSKMNPFYKANQAQGRPKTGANILSWRSLNGKAIAYIFMADVLIFGAAGFQQLGLITTTAGNAGFITTLYVVLVPTILTIFWREEIQLISWLGAGIAIIGSLLLNTGGKLHLASGDALKMAGAVLWALHVILISRAVKFMDVLTFSSGQYIIGVW
jgi:drug/metabolite transporter (DMT)-like permease